VSPYTAAPISTENCQCMLQTSLGLDPQLKPEAPTDRVLMMLEQSTASSLNLRRANARHPLTHLLEQNMPSQATKSIFAFVPTRDPDATMQEEQMLCMGSMGQAGSTEILSFNGRSVCMLHRRRLCTLISLWRDFPRVHIMLQWLFFMKKVAHIHSSLNVSWHDKRGLKTIRSSPVMKP
jgi:hypothetical protein